jgi:hypothetical protein
VGTQLLFIVSIKYNIFLANKLLIFGGMNNQNYLGSSLFVVTLDFNYVHEKETAEEHELNLLKKSAKILGPEINKKIERLKTKIIRRQISVTEDINLPPIK